MLGSYQVEYYRVLQSTHVVTLLLNLPVYDHIYAVYLHFISAVSNHSREKMWNLELTAGKYWYFGLKFWN